MLRYIPIIRLNPQNLQSSVITYKIQQLYLKHFLLDLTQQFKAQIYHLFIHLELKLINILRYLFRCVIFHYKLMQHHKIYSFVGCLPFLMELMYQYNKAS